MVFGEAELVQIGLAGVVDHRWRATAHDERGIRRLWQMLGDHLLGDETRRVFPVLRRAVERVPEVEAVGVSLGEGLELIAAEDIILGLVREDQRELGRVFLVEESRGDDLEAGRDAGSASHEADARHPLEDGVAILPRATTDILDLAQRAAHLHVLANRNAIAEVLRESAALGKLRRIRAVRLDDKIAVALDLIGSRRRVCASDELVVDVAAVDKDVLADGEAEDVVIRGQRESQAVRVVREGVLANQLELDLLVAAERHLGVGCVGRRDRRRGGELGGGGVADDANGVVLEQLPSLDRVDGDEVLGRVLAAEHEDGLGAARVILEVGRRVVDDPVDFDPARGLVRVLGELLARDDVVLGGLRERGVLRRLLRVLGRGGRGGGLGRLGGRLARGERRGGGLGVDGEGGVEVLDAELGAVGHPAALLLARHGRVLGASGGDDAVGRHGLPVHEDGEPGVVEHAHDVPGQVVGLRVHG
mmetsp:Transcript_836/g.2438  ORF Transcript_836/g.2438 Transcript_836/m.2438 type:complete len:476 (-) Transcript_836:1226-2653(-)